MTTAGVEPRWTAAGVATVGDRYGRAKTSAGRSHRPSLSFQAANWSGLSHAS